MLSHGFIRHTVVIERLNMNYFCDYFCRAELISDNFGNSISSRAMTSVPNPQVRCDQILYPGDVVRFRCKGDDPQGCKMKWDISVLPGFVKGISGLSGNRVTLTWKVTEKNIASRVLVIITLTSMGGSHRWPQGTDSLAVFHYEVARGLGK